MSTDREYYSTTEVCDQLGVSRPTVIKMLRDGQLEGVRFGTKWLVSIAGLRRYLAENTSTNH